MSFAQPFVFAALVSLVLTRGLAALAPRIGWVDAPTLERKRQSRPVPPVGGVAIVLACAMAQALAGSVEDGTWQSDTSESLGWLVVFAPWSTTWHWPLDLAVTCALASVLAGAVGLLDDLRSPGLGAGQKLSLQFGLAFVVGWAVGVRIWGFDLTAALPAYRFAFLSALFAVVAVNLANTFDHADGSLGSIAWIGLVFAGAPAAAGAVFGFLPWNLNAGKREEANGLHRPPTAYLGDAGSHLLGAWILLCPQAWPVLLVPALDLARLSVARLVRGSRPWIGDREHLGHRL